MGGTEHQGLGQEQHAALGRRHGLQEGHDAGPDARVRRTDPGSGHPERDQGRLLAHRFLRCGRSACRISKLKWKMGKETGGKKMEDPHSLKSNEMAQCSFQPQQPLVCDTFKNCEGLSRVAFMDGNGVVMLGKVVSCEKKEEGAAGGKKK